MDVDVDADDDDPRRERCEVVTVRAAMTSPSVLPTLLGSLPCSPPAKKRTAETVANAESLIGSAMVSVPALALLSSLILPCCVGLARSSHAALHT